MIQSRQRDALFALRFTINIISVNLGWDLQSQLKVTVIVPLEMIKHFFHLGITKIQI